MAPETRRVAGLRSRISINLPNWERVDRGDTIRQNRYVVRVIHFPMLFWVWSLGTVGALGTVFWGLARLSRKWLVSAALRRSAVVALWVAAATLSIWLLFALADARAAVIHQQNVGMAVVYIYFWLLAIIPAPALGFALSRIRFFSKHSNR